MHQHYNKPGLWFVKSGQPLLAMTRIVSEYGVKTGLPMSIYTESIETIKREVAVMNNQEDCEYFWTCNASDCSWDKYLNVSSSNFETILVDGLTYLYHDHEAKIGRMLPLIDKEAKEYGKTVIIFVTEGTPDVVRNFIMQHLIR